MASVPSASAFHNEPSMGMNQHDQYDVVISLSAVTEMRDRMKARS